LISSIWFYPFGFIHLDLSIWIYPFGCDPVDGDPPDALRSSNLPTIYIRGPWLVIYQKLWGKLWDYRFILLLGFIYFILFYFFQIYSFFIQNHHFLFIFIHSFCVAKAGAVVSDSER
jgi:hypothetical protein